VRSIEQARVEELRWVLEEIRHAQRMSAPVDLTEVFSLFAMGILGRLGILEQSISVCDKPII
jgi:hypothetical protein